MIKLIVVDGKIVGWTADPLVDGLEAPADFDPARIHEYVLDGEIVRHVPSSASLGIKVSPVEFMLLFTATERVAIKAARQTDPMIDDFLDIVEDPRLTFVDLALPSTRGALAYLAAKNLISEERQAEILSGVIQ